MKHIQADIRTFMLAAKQECPDFPTIVPPEVRILRARLIVEEALEQVEALGVDVAYDSVGHRTILFPDNITFRCCGEVDLVKFADGCANQVYVSVGGATALGINLEPVWQLVQAANMAKFGPGSYQRPDGKQTKPPGWLPPNEAIRAELKLQCTHGNNLCSKSPTETEQTS